MTTATPPLSRSALRAAVPFTTAGAAVTVIGALTWLTGSWVLRAAGLVAVAVGGYVLLVGIGLLRARAERRRRAAQASVDAAVLATAAEATAGFEANCPSGQPCGSCDSTCALRR